MLVTAGDGEFDMPYGTVSSGGRIVWVGDSSNSRIVCVRVSGRGDASRLRWTRVVPVTVAGPFVVAVGARTGPLFAVSGHGVVFA